MAVENDPQSVAVIERWRRDKERLEAKVEASEKNFQKTFGDLLRNDNVKRALAQDAQAATKDPGRRENTRSIDALRNRSIHRGYDSDETITGLEPLPWDR
jgi:hypothetical protein